MGIFNQPLNQNRQPNQRRPYNSGDSNYNDDDRDDDDNNDGDDGGDGGGD